MSERPLPNAPKVISSHVFPARPADWKPSGPSLRELNQQLAAKQKTEPPKTQPKQEQKSGWPSYAGYTAFAVGLVLSYAHLPTGILWTVVVCLLLAMREAKKAH